MTVDQPIPMRVMSSTRVAAIPSQIPSAPYRHAAPSGPWPWQNLDDYIPDDGDSIVHTHDDIPGNCEGCHWSLYPESLFPNWKSSQVARSRMKELPDGSESSKIYHIDVDEKGNFLKSDNQGHIVSNEEDFERLMKDPTEPRRLSILCVDNLTQPVMQLLGTKYVIEPFFWSTSVNWIPARYQENLHASQDDHITITLKFARATRLDFDFTQMTSSEQPLTSAEIIDTQRPLPLRSTGNENSTSDSVLIIDFLAIHMVRAQQNSTIITYHPKSGRHITTAEKLYTRISLAGQSVYWQQIFRKSPDPTFVLLSTLWYVLYAWDEAFETLWTHICELERQVIQTNNMNITHELHKIRAHLLHYATLLEEFNESVIFVQETANPAIDSPGHTPESTNSRKLLEKECINLLIQIKRLKISREMWDKRLKNVMDLVFSSVNIEDSKRMQVLTKATVRDSAAMKQISYLTMVFLPASFAASIFGMNVQEISPGTKGTLSHYFATALPLTIMATWVIVAYQGQWTQTEDERILVSVTKRLLWPVMLFLRLVGTNEPQQQDGHSDTTVVNQSRTSPI